MTQVVLFISYSHEDEKEKDKLLTHLDVLQKEGLIDLWSDDRIGAGADWRQKISEAMAQARVAVLLISANFLTSHYILSEEVPRLLKRRESEGLTIFPVIIKPCVWQEVGWLNKMKVRPKNGRPIWRTGNRRVDEDLATIAQEIASIVKTASPVTPTTSDVYVKSESAESPPQLSPDFLYDVFVSYSRADLAWVRTELLPRLEAAGLKVWLEFRDFEAGTPRPDQFQYAVENSRRMLLVLTPAYLKSEWDEFANLMAQTRDPASHERRLIPLLKAPSTLPLRLQFLWPIDFVDPVDWDLAWNQLLKTLVAPLPSSPR